MRYGKKFSLFSFRNPSAISSAIVLLPASIESSIFLKIAPLGLDSSAMWLMSDLFV